MLIKREKLLACELGDLGLISFRIHCHAYSMHWTCKGTAGIYRSKHCTMLQMTQIYVDNFNRPQREMSSLLAVLPYFKLIISESMISQTRELFFTVEGRQCMFERSHIDEEKNWAKIFVWSPQQNRHLGTVDYMKLTRTNSENHNGLWKGSTGKNIIIMQIEKWNTSLVWNSHKKWY